ncbi:MAG TPA: DUF4397 domain-containing protein [Euzebyales bacterium]|nr:DUF4397 domain-containing protein [Euzebyales bacterium]
MRRICSAAAIVLTLLLVAGPAAAQSDTATVTLIHGFRGLLADVYLDGDRILEGFAPERSTDPTELPVGSHTVEVREADAAPDSEPVVEGTLDLQAGANLSAVVHPDADGEPTISLFDNAFDAPRGGDARAVVRHTAVAPAIDVTVGDVEVATGLQPGAEDSAVIDPRDTEVVATASSEDVLPPERINVAEGTTVALYLIGSDGDRLGWLSQRLDTSGPPAGVPTGNSGLAAPVGVPWWAVAAAGLAVLASLRLVLTGNRLTRLGGS